MAEKSTSGTALILPPVKKSKKGMFGLAEIEAFLAANPGVSKEDVSKLKSWTTTVLRISNTVKRDIGLKLDALGTIITSNRQVITGQEAVIDNAKKSIVGAQATITDADAQIAVVKKIAELFGS